MTEYIHTTMKLMEILTWILSLMMDAVANLNAFVQRMQHFSSRNMWCVGVCFETSHGKSKSDGFGGVVKGYARRDMTTKKYFNM